MSLALLVSFACLYRIHGNAEVMISDSMLGARLANTLLEEAAACEISRLHALTLERSAAARAIDGTRMGDGLAAMQDTFDEYEAQIFTDRDRANWQAARACFLRYQKAATVQILGNSGTKSAEVEFYGDLHSALRILRDYNRTRSMDLALASHRNAEFAMRVNLIVVTSLIVLLALLTSYLALRRGTDVGPEDF